MKKINKKQITIKETILNYFANKKGQVVDTTKAAKDLKLSNKNLMSHLWCMSNRQDRLSYYYEELGECKKGIKVHIF